MSNADQSVHAMVLGAIPAPPFILCKTDKAAELVRGALHHDWSRTPEVIVAEEDKWPTDWEYTAVVVTPLKILGSDKLTSFSIDADLSDMARKVLNSYISIQMAQGGGGVSYRKIGNALGVSRQAITGAIKELEAAGIGRRRDYKGFSLEIGTWRPDARKAKAMGIKIKEY